MSIDESRQRRTSAVSNDRLNPEQPPSDEATLSDHLRPENADHSLTAGTMRAGEAGSVDDADDSRWTIEVGSDVIGTCGHKVGEVVAVRNDHVVVEKGFFMPTDFYIPKSAIQKNDDHGLYLNVTRDEALHYGWDVDPAASPRI
ncbi:MAG: DUF2171 domain-containing protein [Chloroflexota bacterium]|nr:DUF2171 domain-containing protein [Chloroflexota bacterium]